MRYTWMESPVGPLLLAGDERGLAFIEFGDGKPTARPREEWIEQDSGFAEARKQLAQYFSGKRTTFDLKLAPRGTEFQLAVWEALCQIPYGETTAYVDIAKRVGRPKAMRAVGAANGANPLPVIVPCHRVIGRDGSLTGYGGGLEIKRALLALERGEGHLPL